MKASSRPAPALAALIAAASLASCGRLADVAAVSRGNRLHGRGLYQEALVAYLSIREPAFGPTLDYDMANVYSRLGETGAASELYERARLRGDAALRADSFFNEGVALYEKSRYEESWRAFREALRLRLADPASFDESFAADARRNLELAWRGWKKRILVPPESASPSGRSGGGSPEEELRLLRRLETGRWKPGQATPPADGRGDY